MIFSRRYLATTMWLTLTIPIVLWLWMDWLMR